jgi:NAD(P)-dependent dehydrogenase (short-subunit alcohol dehydrogenase family)
MANYLIIGASSGIGQAVARNLLSQGHSVFGTFNTHPIDNQNSNLSTEKFNVLEDKLDEAWLPKIIDGLVYCPGSIHLRPFERIKSSDFIQDFQLQVIGAIEVMQWVLPKLKLSEHASVVLFSSVAAQMGLTFHSQVSLSKGAIEGLVRALAAEYSPRIRFNAVAPSLTDTPLANALVNSDQKREANAQRHPMKRIGTAEDIAAMVEFLLSTKSSWVTGQVMHVDGGISSLK